ncbi:oxygen-independent coproporphyrinogen III oxidase [Methyloraptor flagellatus]|uniref:Coproporphyrinogen-III oxidase n=1 Tax=Methyloraptor flagellatus TaxID=3162530 RepID=A0AAU7X853_9HYPH
MTTSLEARYATRNVPRYTSYPTAPHFDGEVGAEVYAQWLGRLDPAVPVSIYLHVPYCRAICHYCGCHTKAALRDDPVVDYAETLIEEIALVRHTMGIQTGGEADGIKPKVAHIHWGGGTPSLLPRQQFLAVTAALKSAFDVLPDAEHAIELDPRTVTPVLAMTLKQAGITRASLGVQDFDPTVQAAIGRVQPYERVADAVAALRGAGIEALNFDLMYGLPHQTAETIRHTVELAHGLEPSRIALFGYAHVPWFKKHQRLIDEAALPGATARIALERTAREALAQRGYLPVGLDHFARPHDPMAIAAADGALRRNFQGYTTDTADTLIGLGASSIGRMPEGFAQNAPDVGHWRKAIEAGRLPVVRGKVLDRDDRLRAAVIEKLMCDYRVDLAAVAAQFGEPVEALADGEERLGELVRDGVVTLRDHVVTVTEAGRPFVRVAAAAFDTYLAAAAARHSVAV